MARALDTARLAGLGDAGEITDDLREVGYGDYEGLTTPEIRDERPGWDLWPDGSPGGETIAEAAARVDRVIERADAAGGDVALFAHGHILRILGARWLGLAPEVAASLALSTASLCDLGYERERRVDLALERHEPRGVTSAGCPGTLLTLVRVRLEPLTCV